MIVEKTQTHFEAEAISALLHSIKPHAAKYKALHKIDDEIRSCGWFRDGKNSVHTRVNREQLVVYEYKKPFETIQDLVDILEADLKRRVASLDSRSIYITPMINFLNQNLGESVELSREQFENRKADTLDVLRRAFEFVNELSDTKNVHYFTLEKSE